MEPQRRDYKGHRIELRARGGHELRARKGRDVDSSGARGPRLLIDDEPVPYGRLPDGRYFLPDYAYDWRNDLMELAQRFIDYRDRTETIRREREMGAGE